jgi:penicillin-binding protein 1C
MWWRFLSHVVSQSLRLALVGAAAVLVLLGVASLVFPLRVDIPYAQSILARDGTLVHLFLSADDKWRMNTALHEISPVLRSAIVYKEDRFFYWHCGINPAAVVRAAWNNLRQQRVSSGASTITMQVARMLESRTDISRDSPQHLVRRVVVRRRTLWNKFIEAFRALQLEARFSKEEILQLYLNLTPYGSNIEGVKAASLLYFGQAPERLSLAQATTLAIIPNRPTTLKLDEANTRIAEERNRWLERFAREGVFPASEVQDALAEPLGIKRRDAPQLAPQLAVRLRAAAPDHDVIRTSLDVNKHLTVQTLVANKIRRLKLYGINNAAALVVDNRTGEVLVYIGSADVQDKAHAGEVDGVRAVRSPGSALKPLIYALAMDKGRITPKTVLTDVPINMNSYAPENFDRTYTGSVTAEQALVRSLNVPAVKLLAEIGVQTAIEALKRAGFDQIRADEKHLGLSLALGGCGVRLEEMVGLYAAFANEGRYKPLRFTPAERSADAIGTHSEHSAEEHWLTGSRVKRTAQPEGTQEGTQIVSPAAAFMLSEILTQLQRPDLPNALAASTRLAKLAWKTGTSYGRRDAWSIGYNKRFTIGVWVGNFSGAGVPELIGAEVATPLLFEIANALDYNSHAAWFAPPAQGIDFRLVCTESGLPPNEFCEHHVTDWYIPGVSSNKRCDHLKRVAVSLDEQESYCADCLPPQGQFKYVLYPNLPSELVALYAVEHYRYKRIPPHNAACKRLYPTPEHAPTITSLVEGKEYLLERDRSGQVFGQLLLTCAAANDVQTVYWFANDQLLRAAAPTERLFFTPQRGEVKISCSDDKGRTTTIWVRVGWQ